jgi:hypothetical protein
VTNAVWTLLRNRDGMGAPVTPLGSYTDPAYRAVTVSPPLARAHTALFGPDPDPWMLDYRARELLTLLHATELDADVRAFDPRITYALGGTAAFQPGILATPIEHEEPLYLSGLAPEEGGSGRLYRAWSVTTLVDSAVCQPFTLLALLEMVEPFTGAFCTAPVSSEASSDEASSEAAPTNTGLTTLQRFAPAPATFVTVADFESGLSTPLTLPGSALQIRFSALPETRRWLVESVCRPARGLEALPAALAQVSGLDDAVFGPNPQGDLLRWRRLWRSEQPLPYRLGGLLLGLATRLQALAAGGA